MGKEMVNSQTRGAINILLLHQEGWLYVIMDMSLQLEDYMQQECSSEQFEEAVASSLVL